MIEEQIEEMQVSFRVEDDSTASWAMRKFAYLKNKMIENERIAKAELDRISEWLEKQNRTLANSAAYFEDHLIDYGRRQREAGRKSISLPYGTIKSVQTQDKVETTDAFIEWAKQNRDDLLSFAEPKPNKSEIKKALDAGQKLVGVEVVPGSVSFSIKVNDEDQSR